MIAPVDPIKPVSPSGNTPDATLFAKTFETELNGLSAVLHNLKPTTLESQLHNAAEHITAVHAIAQKALTFGQS